MSTAVADKSAIGGPGLVPHSLSRSSDVALRLDDLTFDYEPFPIAVARNVFDPATYVEMVESFPTVDDFVAKHSIGVKYSLSPANNRSAFVRYVSRQPVWRRFYAQVKSPSFIPHVLAALRRHGIDLGLYEPSFGERMHQRFRALKRGRPLPRVPKLKARFEFSAMPITGGSIRPHTDDPAKIVTMVISMLRPDEWQPAWGGGTSVVWPKDVTKSFNLSNRYLEFDEVRTLRTFAFQPNQCIVFVKTSSSWHMVQPMTGTDPSILRKTLTINIESS